MITWQKKNLCDKSMHAAMSKVTLAFRASIGVPIVKRNLSMISIKEIRI